MKVNKIIAVSIGLFSLFSEINAQESTINFSYDQGGKMKERSIQVFPGARFSNPFQAKDSSEKFTPSNFKIFPNPTSDYLNIEGDLPKDVSEAKIQILNMNGQILKEYMYYGTSKQIDVANLVKGVYFLHISYSEKEKDTYKIIIN